MTLRRPISVDHPHVIQATVTTPPDYTGPVSILGCQSESRLVLRHRLVNVHEVSAWGQEQRQVVLAPSLKPLEQRISEDVLVWSRTPWMVWLSISDAKGTQYFTLTGSEGARDMHRRGQLVRSREHHVQLGRFGWLSYLVTMRADAPNQLDFVLDWHNAHSGSPDRPFTSVRIGCASDAEIHTRETWFGKTLDAVLPQRCHRAWRFSVTEKGKQPVPEYRYAGCENFLGFKIPGDLGPVSYAARLDAMKASTPTGVCWIAGGPPGDPANSTYGGVTGGGQMWPLYGIELLVSGDPQGYELLLREQERNICRDRIDLKDGEPLRAADYLDAQGNATWRKFDNWETYPAGVSWPTPGPRHADDPRAFDDYDLQHSIREQNENLALMWFANDWLAKKQLQRARANARMVFYEGPGRANRWTVPSVTGRGSSLGRAEAWQVWASNWLDSTEEFDGWFRAFREILATAQMPSGLFQVNPTAKEAQFAPFSSKYLLNSGLEECYLALAAWACGLNPSSLHDHAAGMLDLQWAPGTGVWSHAAMGPVGSTQRYRTRDEWPQEIRDGLPGMEYPDAYHLSYMIAAHRVAGSPRADEMLCKFTGKATVPLALAEVRSWLTRNGKNAPSAQTGTPVDNYWPLIAAWT